MSRDGIGQRLAVFVGCTALVTAAASAFGPLAPVAAPTGAALEAFKAKMVASAHLHPAAAVPAAVGPALWCTECHPGLAHPGDGVGPAMLNEHASRMDCLLCHWSASVGTRPAPVWQVQAGGVPFLAILPRERSSKEQLAALRSAAAVGRRCFERGPGCAGCHRPGSIGVLVRPGSSPSRVAALERLGSHLTLAPGEKWYFPRLQ